MTPRRPIGNREDSLREPLPLHISIGCLGVIYKKNLAAGTHKNITTNQVNVLTFLYEKLLRTRHLKKPLIRYDSKTFREE